MTTKDFETRIADALVRAFIWLYVGTLFGALFGLFLGTFLAVGQFEWSATMLAGTLAAGAIAAFYAWTRAATIGAIFGIAQGSIYMITVGSGSLFPIILAGGMVAAVIGVLIALASGPNHTALPKILTGCGAGLAAAGLAVLTPWLLGDFQVAVISALTMLLAAVFYRFLVEPVVRVFGAAIPSALGAMLVAGGWGATMSLGTWMFGTSLPDALDPSWIPIGWEIMPIVLHGALGGGASGMMVGFALGILGVRWLET